MADRRVVVEHEDGRRVSVMEADFTNAEHNPFNLGGTAVNYNANTGERMVETLDPRPLDDHMSLKDEGFQIVGFIDDEGHEQGLES